MHLVRVSDSTIWDLDSLICYDLVNPSFDEDYGSQSFAVRLTYVMSDEEVQDTRNQTGYTLKDDPEMIEQVNRQSLAFWKYLVGLCRFDCVDEQSNGAIFDGRGVVTLSE